MSRTEIFFLLFIAPALSLVLALLGLETLGKNLLGWILLVVGIAYPAGVTILYCFQRKLFWQGTGEIVKEDSRDRSFWTILPGMLLSLLASPLEYLYFAWFPSVFWIQVLGLTLALAGIVLLIWARYFIKNMHSAHPEAISAHKLIVLGPYLYVRYPSYPGFVLAALGIAVGYGSITGVAAILFMLLPGLAHRIR